MDPSIDKPPQHSPIFDMDPKTFTLNGKVHQRVLGSKTRWHQRRQTQFEHGAETAPIKTVIKMSVRSRQPKTEELNLIKMPTVYDNKPIKIISKVSRSNERLVLKRVSCFGRL